MAELVLRIRDREMNRVGITKTRMTLGRDTTSDLLIDNAGVSRTHATVSYKAGSYSVRDEDSENGITVNGKRVRKAVLEYGDLIGIGKFEIEIVESDHEAYDDPMDGRAKAPKDVMKTMRMDPATVARMRDEAIARIAAQKGLPAPVSSTASSVARPAVQHSRPAPAMPRHAASAPMPQAPAVSSGMSTGKLIAIIVISVVAGGGGVLLLLK